MGQGIYFFTSNQDNQLLCEYGRAIGLHLVAPMADAGELSPSDDPTGKPFCYLSTVSKDQLHPYGNPRIVGPATDPLLEFLRSYRDDGKIVMGRIHWSDDVPELSEQTKPYFSKLKRWIKKNWEQLPDGQFIGPQAQRLVDEGAECIQLPSSVTASQRVI